MRKDTIDPAIAILERRVATNSGDGDTLHQLAVLLLAPGAESYYYRRGAVLRRARKVLSRAIELAPGRWDRHALLGFVLTHRRQDHPKALESFQEALRLNPGNKVLQVFIPELLTEMGRENEAKEAIGRAARLQRINLNRHRAALRKAGLPANAENLLQAFIRPRNFFVSDLWRDAEKLRRKILPAAHREAVKAGREDCLRRQRELRASFDASRVPVMLRGLAPAAARYGVGDDVCRPLLMKRMSRQTRVRLVRRVQALAEPIAQWLDSYATGRMSDEAVAFMYLLEGIDEIESRS